MLDILPPELILEVLRHVTLSTVATLRLVSSQWSQFIVAHEAAVYRQVAYRHGFISSSEALLDEVRDDRHGDMWKEIRDWQDLCYRSTQLDKNWRGKGRSVVRVLHAAGNHVHRIKVDEERRFVITTHRWGGLTVTDLNFPGKVLWSLSNNYTRHYAHCEYSNGYLIFDRPTDQKEVWRLASTFTASEPPTAQAAPPDRSQLGASHMSQRVHTSTTLTAGDTQANRGHFRPWALLRMPEHTRAYRFVYPHLLTANPQRAFVFDVRTGELVQTIEDVGVREVTYVELSARHVIVCGTETVRVFNREGGHLAFEVPSMPAVQRLLSVAFPPGSGGADMSMNAVLQPQVMVQHQPSEPDIDYLDEYLAAHVSADGRDMVIMREQESVFFIQDFERIARGEVTFQDAALEVRIVSGVHSYLAFEHGRVAVASSNGLYIFHLNPAKIDLPRSSLPSYASFPYITLSGTAPWKSPFFPHEPTVTCLQMTDRRVFFTWNARGRALPIFDMREEKSNGHAPAVEAPGEGGMHWDAEGDDEMLADAMDEDDVDEQDEMVADALDHDGILEDPMEDALLEAHPLAMVPWGNPNEVEVGCLDLSLMPS